MRHLMIENPGVAEPEAFTLFGGTTSRYRKSPNVVGKFGTGNKHGTATLLRHGYWPLICAGNLKMEFSAEDIALGDRYFKEVHVKYSGTTADGKTPRSKKSLNYTLDYGALDWEDPEFGLREYVSNALDRADLEAGADFVKFAAAGRDMTEEEVSEDPTLGPLYLTYLRTCRYYDKVAVELVNENEVRARKGFTRIFIPADERVERFVRNLGKWFLHFSEPTRLYDTLLPKNGRSLTGKDRPVIYRRGVLVREVNTSLPSLYDYNLESLALDEARKVDDYKVSGEAAQAFGGSAPECLATYFQATLDGRETWESRFSSYDLFHWGLGDEEKERRKANWGEAFRRIMGDLAVVSSPEGGEVAQRKGYKVLSLPDGFRKAAESYGLPTPATVLDADTLSGRTVQEPFPSAVRGLDDVWAAVELAEMTNGKSKPGLKDFSTSERLLGYYRDGTVYVNTCIDGSGVTYDLVATLFEEVGHHCSGAADGTRHFSEWLIHMLARAAGIVSAVSKAA